MSKLFFVLMFTARFTQKLVFFPGMMATDADTKSVEITKKQRLQCDQDSDHRMSTADAPRSRLVLLSQSSGFVFALVLEYLTLFDRAVLERTNRSTLSVLRSTPIRTWAFAYHRSDPLRPLDRRLHSVDDALLVKLFQRYGVAARARFAHQPGLCASSNAADHSAASALSIWAYNAIAARRVRTHAHRNRVLAAADRALVLRNVHTSQFAGSGRSRAATRCGSCRQR